MKSNNTKYSHADKSFEYAAILILALGAFVFILIINMMTHEKQQKRQKILQSFQLKDVVSLKIQPEAPYAKDDSKIYNFTHTEEITTAFIKAFSQRMSYKPQHDQAIVQWSIQLQTQARTLKIGCYIPDYQPDIVVGKILTSAGSEYFQSWALLEWYQKYGHYWGIGAYQHEQYQRVIPFVQSFQAQQIKTFTLLPQGASLSERQNRDESSRDLKFVREFVQALDDVQFAAPTHAKFLAQWIVRIRTRPTILSLECFIPADNSNVGICSIDSHEGYTYFQSRHVFEWYQKYRQKWLDFEMRKHIELKP